MDKPVESLYIPVNIKTRFEFFDGYGIAELRLTLVTTLASGFFAFVINLLTGNFTLAVLMVLISTAASVMALAKDQSHQSVIDHIRFLWRFGQGQRIYPYYYTDEWRGGF